MYSYVQRAEQREVVAVLQSQVSADFVATTLAAHGVTAISVHCFGYPSVDFVQGVRVTVAVGEAEAARSVLRALGGRDPDEVE
jgi:hypothetical protein